MDLRDHRIQLLGPARRSGHFRVLHPSLHAEGQVYRPYGTTTMKSHRGRHAPHRISTRAYRQPASAGHVRSEEHTSELQSLMRISYAVFCLKKKKKTLLI